MAKKELFRGFSRIFVDAGKGADNLKDEIFSGFSRISIDDDKGAETEITIKSADDDDNDETLQTSTPANSDHGIDIEIADDGAAESDATAVEQTIVAFTSTTETETEEMPLPEAETTPSQPATQPLPKIEAELATMKATLAGMETALKDSQHKDALIRDLHKEMESLKNDFYASLRRPLIKSIIAIHRRMDERQKYMEKSVDAEGADYKALLDEAVKNMDFDCTSVLDTLEDEYDLIYFEPTVGDAYNPKEENAVKVEETDNPALGGTVKDVVYGGFREASTGRVWQKANIVVYRIKK